jgi:hypothetical protein
MVNSREQDSIHQLHQGRRLHSSDSYVLHGNYGYTLTDTNVYCTARSNSMFRY